MVLKWLSSEDNLGTIELQNCVQVRLNALVVPREDRAYCEVLEVATSGLLLHLLEEACFPPVPVHEHDGLTGALLPAVSVSVLVASVRHKIDIFLSCGDVRSEDLPIVPAVLKLHFTIE